VQQSAQRRNLCFFLTGLGAALAMAVLLSPLASKKPDGLDRISEDHGFAAKALNPAPAQQLPFHAVFDEYAMRGVPAEMATPLAGLVGTLASLGLTCGLGKLLCRLSVTRGSTANRPNSFVD
jgi:cobalt/nickel transport protein